jgi:hypothetical protein
MERLYLLTINWAQTPDAKKIKNIEAVLPGRWMRFNQDSWLLFTTQTSQQIYGQLAPNLTVKDSELILRVDEGDWWGFAQPWVWNWIRSRGHSIS